MNKSVKKYLRRVRGWLPCTRRMKNDIMARIEDSLLSWAACCPGPRRIPVVLIRKLKRISANPRKLQRITLTIWKRRNC